VRRVTLGTLALALAFTSGCAVPASHSSGPYTALDRNTEYRIDERPGGFRVSVNRFYCDKRRLRHGCSAPPTSPADRRRPHPRGHGPEYLDRRELLRRERDCRVRVKGRPRP